MLDLNRIPEAIRSEGGVSRRLLLAWSSSLAALPLVGVRAEAAVKARSFAADPFSLGVASGDPDATGVVLWTRLATDPADPHGGMKPEVVPVDWELAEDDAMKKVVRRGTAFATPQLGHSVHVEVGGLKPDRWYWFRFRAGDAVSPIGRTRTMPAADIMPERLRFAFASCQHFEAGLFTAYEQMAKDEVDLVFHLGDYIYEYPGKENQVRRHSGPKDGRLKTLADYRQRHAQYRADPLLSGMHARCPWFVTWDDHEFENNYASLVPEKRKKDEDMPSPEEFLAQRAAAYQAYYEAMPLRRRSLPQGPNMTLYRKSAFGRLAEFFVLDTRQYRSDQPNGDGAKPLNSAALDPRNTLLGSLQRNWLQAGLISSTATWNVLAQQVMMGMVGFSKGPAEPVYSMDQWPGAAAERMSLVRFMADRRVPNPVVLTGDIHSNWVNNLREDDRKADGPVVATEFVGTSISSGGNGTNRDAEIERIKSANPCVRFHNRERGYVRCTVTPSQWLADYVVCEEVTKPGGRNVTRASFVVEAGQPGAKPA
jgi:alkaline phosphatase D